MSRRDLSLTIALCASLVAHAVLALITFEGAARQLSVIRIPGFAREAADVIDVDAPSPARLGGLAGDGLSPNATPGAETTRAKVAPNDQALLSRDPQGPGRIGDAPSDSLLPQTDGPEADATAMTPLTPPTPQAPPVLPVATDARQPFGAGADVALVVAPRRPAPPADPAPPQLPAASNKPAADPARESPSESDAFSTLGGVEFRDGRIESRLGRAFRSVRPQLSLAGQIDLMSLAERRIVLKIAIDATGKVTRVDVMRSTGSDLVDQPVKLAMYQWWFEPPKGPTGSPLPETFVFPISWH